MKIIYKDIQTNIYSGSGSRSMPVRYRITLRRNDDHFEIKREFFNSGYCDGERDDKVFCDRCIGKKDFYIISIMTLDIDNKEYLDSLEKKLMLAYINKCKESIPNLKKELKEETKLVNDKVNGYTNDISFLTNYHRREKLKKINNERQD